MSSPTAVFEHSLYIGGQLAAILYGIQLVLYFATLRAFGERSGDPRRSDIFFIIYSTVLMVLITIDVATNAVWGEEMWINSRSKPGGVEGFIAKETSVWYETLSSTSAVCMIFMSDGLLIYRTFILFASNALVVGIPILMYLSAFALAIIELVIAGTPNGDFFGTHAASFGVPYYALSISLNILLTILIVVRLLSLARSVRETMGPSAAHVYTGVAALMVESAAPYAAFGIMFLVPYARGSQLSIAFAQVWAKITCIAPTLIAYRVLRRRAWDRDTVSAAVGVKLSRGRGDFEPTEPIQFATHSALGTGVSSTAQGSKSQVGFELPNVKGYKRWGNSTEDLETA